MCGFHVCSNEDIISTRCEFSLCHFELKESTYFVYLHNCVWLPQAVGMLDDVE